MHCILNTKKKVKFDNIFINYDFVIRQNFVTSELNKRVQSTLRKTKQKRLKVE